jgi:hypothetical protein
MGSEPAIKRSLPDAQCYTDITLRNKRGTLMGKFLKDEFIKNVSIDESTLMLLSIQVKDQKIKMEFMTGDIRLNDRPTYRTMYYPEENMPELRAYYKKIHDDLLADLLKQQGF